MRLWRVVRGSVRAVRLALVTLLVGLVWLLGNLGLRLAWRGRTARQVWLGRCLTRALIWCGATFIKVGQIMSTRADLLPAPVIAALTRLQDDVGAFAMRHVRRAFLRGFGQPPEALFASFDPVPVASASVAQVHRASSRDGRMLAVKVCRPGLAETVRFDLAVMRGVAWLLARVPSIRLFAPVESIDEFGRSVWQQIDLRHEAANNLRFARNFASNADVRFPRLEPDLCGPEILTMEFIDGVKLTAAPTAYGVAGQRLARIGMRTLLQMIFADGFVHADLHPGNVLVTRAGEVVIIDLGFCAELAPHERVDFARFYAAWAAGDGATMAAMTRALSPSKDIADYPGFVAAMQAFAAQFRGKALGELSGGKVAADALGVLRRFRVRANPALTMCNVSIAVTEGVGKQLDPSMDLMAEAMPFFVGLFAAPAAAPAPGQPTPSLP